MTKLVQIYVEGVSQEQLDDAVENLQDQIDALGGNSILAPNVVDGDTTHAPTGEAVFEAIKVVQNDVDTHEARVDNPHSVTAAQIGAEQLANKGQANGYVPLNGSSQIPQQYLPSFVDDVLEFGNLAAFPATGETGKIYVAIDTGRQYRWSGSAYIQITNGLIASTDDIPEGTNNKYSTNSRVLNYVLTGLTAAASRVLPDAADSIITAWGKVLKYLTDLGTAAFLNVGTTSGTVAAGDDSRFDNATTPVVFHDDGGYNRNPADNATYYLKTHITQSAVTTSSQGNGVRFRCPRNLTFVSAQINAMFIAGSSEGTTFTINNVTAGTSQTITSTANYSAVFSTNHSFSFSCSENDYIEVRMICPTWSTNPTVLNQIVTIYYR